MGLIGVLTGVVADTTEKEEANMSITGSVKTLKAVFEQTDSDNSKSISHAEFNRMLQDPTSPMMKALTDLGIPEDRLVELGQHVFGSTTGTKDGEGELTFSRF